MSKLGPRTGLLLALLLAGCSVEATDDVASTSSDSLVAVLPPPVVTSDPTFYVKALGRMCLDFGGQAYWAVGAPVTLYWCNGTVAQQVGVHEIPGASHDVNLRVGSQYCIGARGGEPVPGAALELQTCNGSDAQEFALDGDSIIAGHRPSPVVESTAITGITGIGGIFPTPPIARELVVTPLGDVTAAKTPLVLGPRELTENEYFRFVATDGSGRFPHSGFVRPTDGGSLVTDLQSATWGTVIDLADQVYAVTTPTVIKADGVTLRGERKLTDNGPQITYADNSANASVFTIAADDVRVTGLRLQGPSDSTGADALTTGILVQDGHRVTIDHVEGSDFTQAAFSVIGTFDDTEKSCPASPPPAPRPTPVRVARCFVHHDEALHEGYGLASTEGAFALFQGNTEYMNRHAVAADYRGESGYVAEDNLVLSSVPSYYAGQQKEHDFDVHGSDNPFYSSSQWEGGFAGDYVQIVSNTFLGTDHENVKIRGEECRTGLLDGNVFTQLQGSWYQDATSGAWIWVPMAVDTLDSYGESVEYPAHFDITSTNAFSVNDPTNDLAVGDFDGDGVEDVFLGTGADWYYSSGATAEWRLLRRAPEHATALRFGDLDGDGRTDVIAVHTPGTLDVSWGGVSSWRPLTQTPTPAPITSFTIGNFDGDRLHGDDVFMTTGSAWFIAPGGRGWTPAQTSGFPMSSLRFGDFDGDGKTDVLSTSGGTLSISSDAQRTWTSLGSLAAPSLDGVFVADLNGDGIADLARQDSGELYYSSSGRAAYVAVRSTSSNLVLHGRFQGGRLDEVLWWNGNHFEIGPGLFAPEVMWSRQEMR